MDSIERAGAHQFERFVEVETAFHEVSKALQVSQRGMSFVTVVNVLRDAEFFRARMPPIPSRYSCFMRFSQSPP